jgi:hypothetical protein
MEIYRDEKRIAAFSQARNPKRQTGSCRIEAVTPSLVRRESIVSNGPDPDAGVHFRAALAFNSLQKDGYSPRAMQGIQRQIESLSSAAIIHTGNDLA